MTPILADGRVDIGFEEPLVDSPFCLILALAGWC